MWLGVPDVAPRGHLYIGLHNTPSRIDFAISFQKASSDKSSGRGIILPFFHHDSIHYDGTILAIFFKAKMKPAKVVNLLNKVDWIELGFKVGKRFIFSQKSLESIRLPKDFMAICT